MAGESYLVVGLGNIGPEYALTRHNMGFIVLDTWAQASNTAFNTLRYGDLAEIHLKGKTIYLLKPSTYMNLSGNAVRYYLQKLPFGTLRMRKAGSDGGHNGLKNIAECIESQNYARIRMGVGHDFSEGFQSDYVLGKLSDEELQEMKKLSEKVIQGVKDWIWLGADRAMNGLNAKNK